MMTKIKYSLIFKIILIFFTSSYSYAQNKTDSLNYYIETNDGNTYKGQILSQDFVKILLNSDKLGEIRILNTNIKKILPIDKKKVREGKYWFDNPQATRYFFSPNGYGLLSGEGYYQNVWCW